MKPPYEIRMLLLYGQITEALGLCKSLLLVKPEAKLRNKNRIKRIHSSLALEGNTVMTPCSLPHYMEINFHFI